MLMESRSDCRRLSGWLIINGWSRSTLTWWAWHKYSQSCLNGDRSFDREVKILLSIPMLKIHMIFAVVIVSCSLPFVFYGILYRSKLLFSASITFYLFIYFLSYTAHQFPSMYRSIRTMVWRNTILTKIRRKMGWRRESNESEHHSLITNPSPTM